MGREQGASKTRAGCGPGASKTRAGRGEESAFGVFPSPGHGVFHKFTSSPGNGTPEEVGRR